ncbi:MAG: FlgD immunoglobulin-like domain containing protein, partial [Patescibacteria group bacterium]
IQVSYSSIPTPQGAQIADITHYVTPPTFDPSKAPPNLSICYTVKQTLATGVDLTLVIKNSSGTTIFSKIQTAVAKGSSCEPWNGLVNGVSVGAGTYQYAFYSVGQLIGSGTFYVTIAPTQPAPVITDLGPNLSTFNPYTQTTTFSYQLTQDAKVHFAIKDSSGTIVRHLQMKGTTNNGFANGTNSVPWDGKNDAPLSQILADGTYTYLIEAENANGQAQSKIGNITISTFGITSVSADPNPFNPELQPTTNLKFTLNQGAYVTITVSNALNNTFVKTIVSNQFYGAGSPFASWNGTDSTNTWVQTGIYNFKVDASLTPGGPVSYSATGNVQVNRTVVVTQNILDVSNIFANP